MPVEKLTGRTTFKRNAKGLEKVWEQLAKDGLRYVVGEWHSHPNGSTQYSSTDLATMIDIEKEVTIANPLLIVGVRSDGISSHTFYCYKNNELLEYKKMVKIKRIISWFARTDADQPECKQDVYRTP